MKVVVFDTNFLLLPELSGIDIFSGLRKLVTEQHELATLSSVVCELERMLDARSKRAVAANVALKLIEQNKVRIYETDLPADLSLLDFAFNRPDVVVCTNDRELKRKLRKHSVPVISPKGENYLTYV
jgi:rRNA-processing protein FCF1